MTTSTDNVARLPDTDCDFCLATADCFAVEKPVLDPIGGATGLRDRAVACETCLDGAARAQGFTPDKWAFGLRSA